MFMSTKPPPTGAVGIAPAAGSPSSSTPQPADTKKEAATVPISVADEQTRAGHLPVLGYRTGRTDRYIGLTGAQILLQMLHEHGVTDAFGYPGGAILPTFDQLYENKLNFILVRHEQGAGHMADGYARATGKPGIVIVTSGPGATNTITPLATACMDSIPIIVFSGQVRTYVIGNDAFQEADVTGISRPVTKRNYLVKNVKDLPRVINEAFIIATTGRPGPVLVDLPVDVSTARVEEIIDDTPNLPGYRIYKGGNSRMVKAAAEMINAAQRPVLYVGGGVIISRAWPE
ncbi:MAG: thiamine pyrophosphate-binding protein, partial [Planctomycetes bacterium]|nr:thiamine pyrophosphate-binding protein [Planctomycetota bacterium]